MRLPVSRWRRGVRGRGGTWRRTRASRAAAHSGESPVHNNWHAGWGWLYTMFNSQHGSGYSITWLTVHLINISEQTRKQKQACELHFTPFSTLIMYVHLINDRTNQYTPLYKQLTTSPVRNGWTKLSAKSSVNHDAELFTPCEDQTPYPQIWV